MVEKSSQMEQAEEDSTITNDSRRAEPKAYGFGLFVIADHIVIIIFQS